MNTIKNNIKKFIPKKYYRFVAKCKNLIFDRYATKSYSQEGEDMILRRLFEEQQIGFYVDVGAHHPKRFSNTYFFYKKGWRGINIDAMPGSMKLFKKSRLNDINIEKPISNKKEILTYYIFNDSALNTFSKDIAKKRNGKNGYQIVKTIQLETVRLDEILEKYLPKDQKIDFLSIDVEGMDLNVLRSNNFKKYRPKVILIEILRSNLSNIENNEITNFLQDIDYLIYAKTVNTIFFIERSFYENIL